MRTGALAAAVVILLAASDCKDANKPNPTLDGHWTGGYHVQMSGDYVTVALDLTQSDTSISGSALWGTATLQVHGTYRYPGVSLTFPWPAVTGFGSSYFAGSLENANTMTGDLSGGPFWGSVPATFMRR